MKTIGIIAEFNPFHNGHKYLIDKCKKDLHADRVVVVMSGDYVQRRAAERLILPVGERQRGSDDDGVAGVDADRVDVLHRADRDHVALTVAHRFKLYFFPSFQ